MQNQLNLEGVEQLPLKKFTEKVMPHFKNELKTEIKKVS